jgi:hypothetical protein
LFSAIAHGACAVLASVPPTMFVVCGGVSRFYLTH